MGKHLLDQPVEFLDLILKLKSMMEGVALTMTLGLDLGTLLPLQELRM